MHIRINFSSSYYKYIYSSDIPKYYYLFRLGLLKRNKMNKFQIGVNFNFIYQVSDAQTIIKMLTSIMH